MEAVGRDRLLARMMEGPACEATAGKRVMIDASGPKAHRRVRRQVLQGLPVAVAATALFLL